MKKSLFAVVALAAALIFVGCKQENKSAVQGISVSPSELPMNPGQQTRLSLTVTPETAQYNSDDVVWTSSDTTVATVTYNGTVTALEVGTANITAKLGEYTAVCAITVNEWIDNLVFNGAYIGIQDTAYYGDEVDTIKAGDGNSYAVKRLRVYVGLFTVGFYMDAEYNFAGSKEGGVVEGFASMYWAPGWLNNSDGGIIFSLGQWDITDKYGDTITQVIPCGKLTDEFLPNMVLFWDNMAAGDQEAAYTQNLKAAGSDGCEGATLAHYTYHSTAEGYGEDGYYSSYVPELFFTEGAFIVEGEYPNPSVPWGFHAVSKHKLTAKALEFKDIDDNNFISYGCNLHYDDENGLSWNDTEIHWGKTYEYNYGLEVTSAPSRIQPQYQMIREFGDMETTKKVQNAIRGLRPEMKANKLAK